MKKYDYMADMGCIKIMGSDCSIFFLNGYGDGMHKVNVCKEEEIPTDADFKGHFTVLKKAWLMYSDCMNEGRQHEFGKGRWFVSLDKDETTFYIYKMDEDLHA